MPDSLWEDETPTVFLIRAAHEKVNPHKWDKVRFTRLTILWNITAYELSAMAGVYDKQRAQRMFQEQNWPMPVRLHFCRLETLAHQLKLGSEHIDPEIGVLAKLAASKGSHGRSGHSDINGEHSGTPERGIHVGSSGS